MERPDLVIAKVIGQPIDSTLPTPVLLSQICDIETAEAGEDVYTFLAYDDNTDVIYTAGVSGELTSVKVSPTAATLLTFTGLQTDLKYVTIEEVLNSKDRTTIARKKAALTRTLDKQEVVNVLVAIQAITSQQVTLTTGQDLYDGILALVHKIEDYGDKYLMICGSTVSEKIDTYDKDNVANFEYRIGLKETMASLGITKIKVPAFAKVQLDSGSYAPVIAPHAAVMVALDSQLKVGKPIIFCRRKISPERAAEMGINPEEGFRLVSVAQVPTIINNSKNILGYGCFAYEQEISAIVNYKALASIAVLA